MQIFDAPTKNAGSLPYLALLLTLVLLPSGERAEAAGLLVADGGFGGALEIEEHSVRVTFNNSVVVTEVTQVFRNLEDRQVEALYTFPVPQGASVSSFSMWIGGKEMIGEVVEKEKARQIYNSYKQQRRDPGLLEQKDYKTFEMRIFPIAARAQQRVQVTYYQELDFDDDRATYVYPLNTVTQGGVDSRVRGRFALDLNVKSAVPVVEVDSPSHASDFLVVRHSDHYYQASLEAQDGDLSRDVVLSFRTERPRTGLDLVTSRTPGEDGFFLLTLTAGKDISSRVEGMDFVFVLDVSGSMGQDGKLMLSRESVGAFLGELGPADRFEVMSFNVSPQTVFRQLHPADPAARGKALGFLRSRTAQGGTRLRPALELAYEYKDPDRPLNVVILSDGMTEQTERSMLMQMIERRPAATRVFCIGVGNEVNRPLLSQLADEAGGLSAFLSRGDDFERQARAFRRKLMRPVGTNLDIAIEGVGVYDVEPHELPNLFHGAPLRLYGRYRTSGAAQVRVRADIRGETIEEWAPLDFPEADDTSPEIERMWAWHRIRALLRAADRRGLRAAVTGEVVRLGEAYSIVTEYTSFLVLGNGAEYRRWKIERRNALRTARDRKSQQRVRDELARLRSQSAMSSGPTGVERERKEARKAASGPAPRRPAIRPAPEPGNPASTAPRQPRRSHDLGGGALDPVSAMLATLLVVFAFVAYRSRLLS